MQISNFGSRGRACPLFGQIVKRLSLDRAVDHFQGALLYLDYFGFCAGVTMSLFLFISFFLQAPHSGGQRGVI
jgi:hypothetical protein